MKGIILSQYILRLINATNGLTKPLNARKFKEFIKLLRIMDF